MVKVQKLEVGNATFRFGPPTIMVVCLSLALQQSEVGDALSLPLRHITL